MAATRRSELILNTMIAQGTGIVLREALGEDKTDHRAVPAEDGARGRRGWSTGMDAASSALAAPETGLTCSSGAGMVSYLRG